MLFISSHKKTGEIEKTLIYKEKIISPVKITLYYSGIAFLGAGLILHKSNSVIVGLTTAAMVWSSVAFGILIGYGYTRESLLVVIIIVVLINVTPKFVKFLGPKTMRMEKISLNIKYTGDSKELINYLKASGIVLGKIRIKDSDKTINQHSLTVMGMIKEDTYVTDIYDIIRKNESVKSLDIQGV